MNGRDIERVSQREMQEALREAAASRQRLNPDSTTKSLASELITVCLILTGSAVICGIIMAGLLMDHVSEQTIMTDNKEYNGYWWWDPKFHSSGPFNHQMWTNGRHWYSTRDLMGRKI